jgi:hypothetical protein
VTTSKVASDTAAPAHTTHVDVATTRTRLGLDTLPTSSSNAPHGATALRALVLQGVPVGATVAAIDLGSSSAKLLVQRVGTDGALTTVFDRKIGCALGKDVKDGVIPAANQIRALDALRAFIDDAKGFGVPASRIPVITTAVVRNSENGAAFVHDVQGLGLVQARVLTGEQEATVGFLGALAMLHGAPGRYATLDLGGGSFQLAVGNETALEDGGSTQVGSNIVLEQLLRPDARVEQLGDVDFARADHALETLAPMPLSPAVLTGRTLVATGGVSKFLRAHLGRDVVTRAEIDALRRAVGALALDARIPFVQGDKDADTQRALGIDTPTGARDYGIKLPASCTLLLHILTQLGVDEVRVSETDARHALAMQALNA